MPLEAPLRAAMVEAVARRIIDSAVELTALDAATRAGDPGATATRGLGRALGLPDDRRGLQPVGGSPMTNVGIVIVSHSSKVAESAAEMVRQMVGDDVPLAWTGGNSDGGLGTSFEAIAQAIDRAWSD